MHSQSRHEPPTKKSGRIWRGLVFSAFIIPLPQALAAGLYSVHIDRHVEKIIVKGNGFTPSTSVTLGGISVNTANVTDTELEIPFATPVYLAIQWEGSYNLILDGSNRISIYIDAPIIAPPPPGGPDCPCITGWEAADIWDDSYLCGDGIDGTQQYIYGSSFIDNSFLSSAFDPNYILYDEDNPGESISFCAFIQNNEYIVSEPVVNKDQYSDCYAWMWANACL